MLIGEQPAAVAVEVPNATHFGAGDILAQRLLRLAGDISMLRLVSEASPPTTGLQDRSLLAKRFNGRRLIHYTELHRSRWRTLSHGRIAAGVVERNSFRWVSAPERFKTGRFPGF